MGLISRVSSRTYRKKKNSPRKKKIIIMINISRKLLKNNLQKQQNLLNLAQSSTNPSITASILYKSKVNLSTSTTNHSFIKKLKQNLQQGQENDPKMAEARRRAAERQQKQQEAFDKQTQKMRKIQEDSVSEISKKAKLAKKLESLKENENVKKISDKIASKTSQLKFKMPDMPGADSKLTKEIMEHAEMADKMGIALFDYLDTQDSYLRPKETRKRKQEWDLKEFEANTEAVDLEMHKDSTFYRAASAMKNTRLGQRFSNLQERMEDSDSKLARGAFMFMYKMKEGMSLGKEEAEVVSEINLVDPNFTIAGFTEQLQKDFLPNVLESACRGEEETLEDWCQESVVALMLANKKLAAKEGLSYQRHIFSLQNVESLSATYDEESEMPCVMISFETQEIVALVDKDGQVVDGSLDKPVKNNHAWLWVRDMEEADPRAAWRVLEAQNSGTEMKF